MFYQIENKNKHFPRELYKSNNNNVLLTNQQMFIC